MAALPFAELDRLSPLDALEARSWRLARAVEATSRRRDVRRFRAQLLILILEHRCPLGTTPARRWYVPGACARLGAEGLWRRWHHRFGEEPPTLRTFKRHLGALQSAGCIMRGPGDWLPVPPSPAHPERRPRYPNTLHVLDTEAAAEWWAGPGAELLARRPDVRCNPDRWRMVFGGWRRQAAQYELEQASGSLFDPPATAPDPPAAVVHPRGKQSAAEILGEVVHRPSATAEEIVGALDRCGYRIRGTPRLLVQRDLGRLRAGVALFVVALQRPGPGKLRNPAGWIVRAVLRAPEAELRRAMARTAHLSWEPFQARSRGGPSAHDALTKALGPALGSRLSAAFEVPS